MTFKEPLFSVIIPTCDRAHLLPFALRSVLDHQTFHDYELIVSDNYSQDKTTEVVRQFGDSRLRYVRTNRRLSMTDHWEFALQHAKGDYVTYLCDDDAWTPKVLSSVAETIEQKNSLLTGTFRAKYHSENSNRVKLRNSFAVTPFTGGTLELDSRDTLRRLFARQENMRMPKMFNSFCHRELIQRARKDYGRLFFGYCPDYSFPALILTETVRWTFIDVPLWLRYYGRESAGARSKHDREGAFRECLSEYGYDESSWSEMFVYAPLRIPVPLNFSVETLLLVKSSFPERFVGFDVDWPRYFIRCWREVLALDQGVRDLAREKEHFVEVLARQDEALRRRVEPALKRMKPGERYHEETMRRLGDVLARKLQGSKLASASWHFLRQKAYGRKGMQPGKRVWGREAGFRTILECAVKLNELVGT